MSKSDLSKLLPAVKCTARKQNGEPCKAMAARGATVCRVHGGSAPQVKAAAARRIQNALDAAAKRLLGFAFDADVSESIALSAVNGILDRGGLSAKNQVEVGVELKPWEQLLKDVVYERGVTRAEHNARRGLPMPVIDAEVVEMGASGHVREQEREERPEPPAGNPATRTRPRSRQLDSAEEAVAETTSANRRSTRRKRR